VPEYLAPGVYVEETSFRGKPIEGVGTSTTAFVGPTRRGPIGETPEIVTSVGDFERIYGGLDRLALAGGDLENYVALAVRAFFDNGGSRLYVSRTYLAPAGSDGRASSAFFVGNATAPTRARFVGRAPGRVGNGRIELTEIYQPATWRSLNAAPAGSIARTGTADPAGPARITGGIAPFRPGAGSVLRIRLEDGDGDRSVDLTFDADPTEVTGDTALPATVPLAAATAAERTLVVTIDGRAQTIVLDPADLPRADLAIAVNAALRGGYARLDGTDLVIGSDVRGTAGSVAVAASPLFGFTSAASFAGTGNVRDIDRVGAADIQALLDAETLGIDVGIAPATGRLTLTTRDDGDTTRLHVIDASGGGTTSAHGALGLAVAETPGTAGTTLVYYAKSSGAWIPDGGGPALVPASADETAPSGGAELVSLTVLTVDADGQARSYEDLAYGEDHPRWIGHVLALEPTRRAEQLENLFALETTGGPTPFALRRGLVGGGTDVDADEDGVAESRRNRIDLTGGSDGAAPTAAAYRDALRALTPLEDISIVAAPGSSALGADWPGVRDAIVTHVERRRAYEIAVLDTAPDLEPGGARNERGTIDSTRAATYYPWIVVANPRARPGAEDEPRELVVPPSGFLCGIYARNDVQRGVHKTPANEVVRGALRFARVVSFGEQEVLNPLGVNCLRTFAGRGHRVWGGRTSTSDQEWKYVGVRRYFNYVEASIDRGMQWAVFEPNGEALWGKVRESIGEFLYAEWRNGALLGASPKEAYFVRCDRSTMTQSDLDSGKLVCEIGIAVLKPAEFVIFRIGQKTADARN
jgi:phage tail sheath protein FI